MAGLLWYRSYMDSLANTSGYYPDIHAGHADRGTELSLDAPYLVRETPAGYNQLELMELVGGSIAWNQLCNSSSVTGTSDHKFYLKKSGVESITNTNTFTGLASGTDMVTDLTQMLNPTIADYVYSLEQATAGSGIAWLKKYDLIDDEYHAYSAPTLQSVEATSHVTKDANNTTIATYPLDSDLVLRGIPKLSNGDLYYDGDTYERNGTVTRKYAEITITSAMVIDVTTTSTGVQSAVIALNPLSVAESVSNAIAEGYVFRKGVPLAGDDKEFRIIATAAYFYDARFTDLATAKSILNGTKMCYNVDTPTTESADPFTAVQTVEEGGAEEFVTGNNVPVGNVSVYRRA